MRAAVYARCSTDTQSTLNQLLETRRFVELRGWQAVEYVDEAVSGSRDSRPALDRLVRDAKRRKCDVVLCWSLDRLGRNLRHLVALLDDLHALGIGVITLREGLDWTTPSGRLQAQLLAVIAEFERNRLRERVVAGIARARAQGKRLGRPRKSRPPVPIPKGLTVREAARRWGISKSTAARWITEGRIPQHAGQSPAQEVALQPDVH